MNLIQYFRQMTALAALFIAGSFIAVSAAEITPELESELDRSQPGEDVSVIVRFRAPVDLERMANGKRQGRRATMIRALRAKAKLENRRLRPLLASHGAKRERQLWLINGRAMTVPAAAVRRIAMSPRVASVSLDRRITLAAVPASCGYSPAGWNLDAVRASELWALGYDGSGIVVGSLDSGVDPDHPDIGARWRGGSNSWFDPNGEHPTPADANGHGTGSMGILVGGAAGGEPIGMAPGAQWISAKIFDDSGSASLSAIHAAFQWMLDPDGNPATDDAADVVNNSWVLNNTIDQCDTEFQADIDALKAADIAVVFSAGNTGPGFATSVSPANHPQSLAVGAVGEAFGFLYVSGSSARGPSACGGGIYPQIAAPGGDVATADLTFGGIFPDSYACVSGTSFAAPHVAGAMALLKGAMQSQQLPVSTSQLEAALLASAVDMGAAGPDQEWGNGLLDVMAAYDWLLDNAGTPQPGSLQFDSAGYSIDEEAGSVTVTVARSGGTAGSVTVDYATSDGSATSGADYVAASGTLTFQDGEASRTIDIDIVDDSDDDDDESFSVSLSNPGGGADLGATTLATVFINDDDEPAGPADDDADGYTADVDCNDNDASVYPGAAEIKHDGVDQDCNGYDLTIDITRARYISSRDKVVVWATTDLGSQGALTVTVQLVEGGSVTKAMNWKSSKNRWQKAIGKFTAKYGTPVSVTVSGVEGSDSAQVEIR